MHLLTMFHVLLAIFAAFIGFSALTSSMPTSNANTLARTVAAKPSTDHAASPHAGAPLDLLTVEHNTTVSPLIRHQGIGSGSANMDFQGFAGGNCDGTHFFISVDYFSYITFQPPINSFILSRNIDNDEELDFASGSGDGLCSGTWHYSPPSVVGPIYGGLCYHFATTTCITFFHY
jgi:hypothetical protein